MCPKCLLFQLSRLSGYQFWLRPAAALGNTLPAHCANNKLEPGSCLWSRLRSQQLEGCKSCRQQVIGPYIVDFSSVQPKLIIEVDGGQHVEKALQDAQRTEYLQRLGYEVVRYCSDHVLRNVEAVMESIWATLIEIPSPPPSPGGRGS